MAGSVFDQIAFEEIEIAGARVRFPIHYLDVWQISASFPAPVAAIQAILPTSKLTPVEIAPNMTLVSLAAFEYRQIVGMTPYNEFGVMVPTLYKADESAEGLPGMWVTHLPVTTQQARWGGVEFYGLPKIIADITFEDTATGRSCRVRLDDQDVITLAVENVPAQPAASETVVYSVKDDHLIRTSVPAEGPMGSSDTPGGASFTLGDHPMAESIKALGMEPTSIDHQVGVAFQMLLHKPGDRFSL